MNNTAVLSAKVPPKVKDRFDERARALGITPGEFLRYKVICWITEDEPASRHYALFVKVLRAWLAGTLTPSFFESLFAEIEELRQPE